MISQHCQRENVNVPLKTLQAALDHYHHCIYFWPRRLRYGFLTVRNDGLAMLVEVDLDDQASCQVGSWDISGTRFLRARFSSKGLIVFGALDPNSLHWKHNARIDAEKVESSFLVRMPCEQNFEVIDDGVWMARFLACSMYTLVTCYFARVGCIGTLSLFFISELN